MKKTVAVIMGGGQGSRLFPLTQSRCKPAVPIGGRYRLIDIPISNCLNSDINKIFVLTQFNTLSLHRHIERTYRFDIFSGGFCVVRAAEQTQESTDWYQGTADAVRQNLRYIFASNPENVIILSGDQLYRMDYAKMMSVHREKDADVTISVHPVDRATASSMGLMHVDSELAITEFREKPTEEDILDKMQTDSKTMENMGFAGDADKPFMANMGIYLFKADVLRRMLENNNQLDFGKEIIPANIDSHKMYAFPFADFWEDIGTVKAFYDVNMMLTERAPVFSFFDPSAPIYTRPRFLPPTKIDHSIIHHSLVSEGGFLESCEISRSLLSDRTVLRKGSVLKDVFIMGADEMEGREQLEQNRKLGRPDIGVGENSFVERAIIDKGVRIGKNVKITSQEHTEDRDGEFYYIRDGITILPRGAIVPDGTQI